MHKYKKGDVLKVKRVRYGHEFPINSLIVVIDVSTSSRVQYKAKLLDYDPLVKDITWWVSVEEVEYIRTLPPDNVKINDYTNNLINNIMKAKVTILVVYTNNKTLTNSASSMLKRYSFNSASSISEGDIIESREYNTPMMVVKVLAEAFNYYNKATGELTNTLTSTEQREIKTLEIRDDDDDIIYGTIKNEL